MNFLAGLVKDDDCVDGILETIVTKSTSQFLAMLNRAGVVGKS
jgi:hypothetical protein